MAGQDSLTVAVTGASGTIGPALLERLGAESSVQRVVALGRRETDAMRAQEKVEFHHVDVRDRRGVEQAVAGCDVVVHMAFSLYGLISSENELFDTNVRGTVNVARAAREAGARRFVYTSSAAVYRGRSDRGLIAESGPVAPATRLFYARHKAQAEVMVRRVLAGGETDPYIFRPCAIVGPHAAGGPANRLPRRLIGSAKTAAGVALRFIPPPPVPLQFVHEDDVAQAVERAVLGQGSPGVYNLAGEGSLEGREALSRIGVRAAPWPRPVVSAGLRALSLIPPLLPAAGWSELVRTPLLVDTTAARERLGWRPRYTSAAALDSTRAAAGW